MDVYIFHRPSVEGVTRYVETLREHLTLLSYRVRDRCDKLSTQR